MKAKKENEIDAPDHIIIPKTHTSMYLMHKYWARKPHNIVSKYIEKYSQPGEVVLDPFCGSGVTVAESLLLGRKCIGIDINPFSLFLTKTQISIVDLGHFEKAFKTLKKRIKGLLEPFYGIKCPYCGESANITQSIWRNENKSNDEPPDEFLEEIRIKCKKCEFKNEIIPEKDFPNFYEQERNRIDWIKQNFRSILLENQIKLPKIPLSYKSRDASFRQIRHYLIEEPDFRNLFTKRNLIVLGIIKKNIDELSEEEILNDNNSNSEQNNEEAINKIRNLLLITFTANLGQSSKMVWVISKRKGQTLDKREVGSWTHHFYWNPTTFFEVNPWRGYKTRFNKTLRAKKNYYKRRKKNSLKPCLGPNFSQFRDKRSNTLIINASAESMILPDSSVDYIFADPPYGDSVQYYELSRLWNGWLDLNSVSVKKHETEELIINHRQNKDKDHYAQKLKHIFRECYRVLKEGRIMTVTFHNTDIEIRNILIEAALKSGFELNGILFQMPPRRSLKAYLHYEKTPTGDYFLKFRKITENGTKYSPKMVETEQLEELICKTIDSVLHARGEPTPSALIFNFIDEELIEKKLFPIQKPERITAIINSLKNRKPFSYDQQSSDWWYQNDSIPENVPATLTSRIDNFFKGVSNAEKNQLKTYSDYYNLVYEEFNGRLTPDRQKITQIIEKYKR